MSQPPMLLSTIDLALRAGSTALLMLLALLLLRDFSRTLAGRLAAAFALGSATYALSSAADASSLAVGWHAPLIALSTGNVVVFWLFARALFDDAFVLGRWHVAIWLTLVVVSLLNCVVVAPGHADSTEQSLGPYLTPALSLIALGFIALTIIQSITSWAEDLVDGRRRLRLFIVGAAAIYGGVNSILQLLLGGNQPPVLVSAVNAAVLVGIVLVVVAAMTRASGEEVFASAAIRTGSVNDLPATAPADKKLIEALDRLMTSERIYRHEGVTIGMLATRLGVPEYRLRRLINQRLGYRNFNVFLNSHRIEEAEAALSDPAQLKVPVTTIALDTGFQSLGPFNRAFKSKTGVTPTEYRRARSVPA
jgi:AraC-like DNA-binding protein